MTTSNEQLRRDAANRMEELLSTAKREGRPLTEGERNQFRDLERTAKRDFSEGGGVLGGHVSRDATTTVKFSGDILKRGDKVTEYARHRGWVVDNKHDERPFRGVGDVFRAMAIRPKNEHQARALSEGTNSQGGFLTDTLVAADFIDRLRANLVLEQLGSRFVPLEGAHKTYRWATVATDPSPAWRAENASVTESDPTFSNVDFEPKSLGTIVRMSNELLQDSPNIEEVVEQALAESFARSLESAVLVQSTNSSAPQAVTNTTASGANLTTLTTATGVSISGWTFLNQAVERRLEANVMPTGGLFYADTYAKFLTLESTGDGQPKMRPPLISDLPMVQTSAMSTARTVAGSTDSGTEFIVADWSKLWVGMRLDLTLTPLRERYADVNQTAILALLRSDVKVTHGAAFDVVRGISIA